jgi:hypothetical protein
MMKSQCGLYLKLMNELLVNRNLLGKEFLIEIHLLNIKYMKSTPVLVILYQKLGLIKMKNGNNTINEWLD